MLIGHLLFFKSQTLNESVLGVADCLSYACGIRHASEPASDGRSTVSWMVAASVPGELGAAVPTSGGGEGRPATLCPSGC